MKQPAFQFYTGDWLKDPALTLCTPAARGVWIDLICAMHEAGRSGELRGTREQLARVARCSTAELTQALTDLQATGAAELSERNGVVTVVNRRMKREAKERKLTANRVYRHRHGEDPPQSNGGVTPQKHPSSSSSSSSDQEKREDKNPPPGRSVDADRLPPASDPPNLQATKSTLKAAVTCALLEQPEFAAAWDAFLEMRRAKRVTTTERAKSLLLRKLEKEPFDIAIRMVEESVMNSWTGIFPLKENYGRQGQESAATRNGRRFREELGKIAAGIGQGGGDEVLPLLPETDA